MSRRRAETDAAAQADAPRNRELMALLELSNRLLGHGDVDALMGHLVEEVRRLLSADASAVLIPEPDGKRITFRAASGWRRGT